MLGMLGSRHVQTLRPLRGGCLFCRLELHALHLSVAEYYQCDHGSLQMGAVMCYARSTTVQAPMLSGARGQHQGEWGVYIMISMPEYNLTSSNFSH